ncbi:MAG: sensor histidine kinase [Verrucomicrobiales bacterium]
MEGSIQLEAKVRHVCLCSPVPADLDLLSPLISNCNGSLEVVGSVAEFIGKITPSVGLFILAQESLPKNQIDSFYFQFQKQPLWSDIPVLLIVEESKNLNSLYEEYSQSFHNLFLLKRPLSEEALIPLLRNLFSLRRHQFHLRHLIEESERSVSRVHLLSKVAHQLLVLDRTHELTRSVFATIAPELGLDVFLNYLYDPESNNLHLNSFAGIEPHDTTSVQRLTLDEALYRKAQEGNRLFLPGGDIFAKLGLHAFVSYPLMSGHRLLGTISFGKLSHTDFSPEDLALLRTISNQVAVAIERKKTERALHDLNQQLEERVLDRTAELQESTKQMEAFTYSVSHDLRAPLRSIHGFSQLLMEDFGASLPSDAAEFVRRIMQSTERMDELITDLLEFSRLSRSSLVFAPVNLDAAVERVMFHFSQELQIKHARIEVQKPLGRVMGHVTTIEQVLLNLISNALKFVRSDVPPLVVISSKEIDGQLRVSVTDNGIGIAPEHQKRVFGLFERLHGVHQYPGTGIGLAIVAKAVSRMDGVCGVESESGKGSSFWFELPKVTEEEPKPALQQVNG